MRNSVPASLVLEAQAISTANTTFSATSGSGTKFCILRTAWISQGTPTNAMRLKRGIAKQLKIGCQAVARLPAADHFIFAVGDKGRGHPRAVRVSPDDDHGIGQPRAQRGEHESGPSATGGCA